MIQFTSFASSSKGNAYMADDGRTRILLECGIPFRELRRRLGCGIGEIDYCLISHEHKDHAKAARSVLDSGITVGTSLGTAKALDLNGYGLKILRAKQPETFGTFTVLPFDVPHDAAEPLGYLLISGEDRLLFATDCGNIRYRFPGLTEIAVECNHDAALMENAEGTWIERAKRTHMDVSRLCAYLKRTDLAKVRHIYLLHMSARYGDERAFQKRIYKAFGVPVTVCGA